MTESKLIRKKDVEKKGGLIKSSRAADEALPMMSKCDESGGGQTSCDKGKATNDFQKQSNCCG